MESSGRELVFLAPIVPGDTGNGLAMRAGLFTKAASADFCVKTLVVPLAGASRVRGEDPATILTLPAHGQVGPAAAALLGSAVWRRRLSRTHPLPSLATFAPASLAAAAAEAARARPGTPVHAQRSYLAPLAIALAEHLR